MTENNFHFIDVHNKNKNNYEKVIGIVGTTLNNINGARQSIYVFGFGDGIEFLVNLICASVICFSCVLLNLVVHIIFFLSALTNHTDLLKFITEPCNGVEEAISEYRRFAMAARSTGLSFTLCSPFFEA